MQVFKITKKYTIESYSFFEKDVFDQYSEEVLKKLNYFNKDNMNLKYGLFLNDSNKQIKFLKQMQLNLIYFNNTIVGFQYFYIFNKKNVHLGLVNIVKNTGIPLLYISGIIGTRILYKKIGSYNLTTITTIPKVLESVDHTFCNIWPSPKRNISRNNKKQRSIIEQLEQEYILQFFPDEDSIFVDKKRAILQMNKRESGFDDFFYKLPKANSLDYNTLCKMWINYEDNEDMIVTGQYNLRTHFRTFIILQIIFINLKLKKGK